jgi:hypothetical protein
MEGVTESGVASSGPEPTGGKPEGEAGSGAPDYFAQDFDPASLSPGERAMYDSFKARYDTVTANIPSPELIQNLHMRATAWDRLTAAPEFQRFVDGLDGGEGGGDKTPTTPDVSQIPGMDALPDETIKGIQQLVDQHVANTVGPIHDEFVRDRVKTELDKCASDYGEHWTRLKESTYAKMQELKVPARAAYLIVRGEELQAAEAKRAAADQQKKLDARMEGDRVGAHTRRRAPDTGKPKSLEEAFIAAESQYDRGETGFDAEAYHAQQR